MSDLVLRDLDILAQLDKPDVGFTITCIDDGLARQFEPGAPSPEKRLRAMSEIAERGIDAWGFFGPVLPTFSDSDEAIASVLGGMQKAGASHVLVDSLNLYPRVWGRLRPFLAREFPERIGALLEVKADPDGYRDDLRERVGAAARSLDVEVEICF
jgi:DNA repair photolyase